MQPAAIGPFQIERELGRGGMGEVFLARDTRLDRDVAIKALPEHLAGDPDRLGRFQREAKVLAMLNHPGIAAIHGLEEVGGRQYLILEFVEGETLADRLGRGPIPVDEALGVAKQIAEALEAAHEKGVVHRDLKPGNVMVTENGAVKVLDFGLARTEERASTIAPAPLMDSPTVVAPQPPHSPTIPGAIMGTAGYMSPEQARGKPVDKRSDIFSFGCVLYEMLSGSQPFGGETVTDSLGAVLHRDPDWGRLPPETPALVQMLLRRCLTKDRKGRLHDIGDARVDLETAIKDPTGSSILLSGVQMPARQPASMRAWWLVMASVLLAAGGVIGWLVGGRPERPVAPLVARFDIEYPPGTTLPRLGEGFALLTFSPAGDTLVFGARNEGKSQLYVRPIGQADAREIAGTRSAVVPNFSPDGRSIVFHSGNQYKRVPIAGGPALSLCDGPRGFAKWLTDGTIAYANIEGIWRVSDSGGTPTKLAAAGPEVRTADGSVPVLGINVIDAVPGADYLLASAWDGDTLQSYTVVAVSLKDGSMRPILKNATDGRFVAPDHLVFLRQSSLMAVPFDPVRGVVTGDAVQVLEGVCTTRWADSAYWAVSDNGSLAYVTGGRMGPGRRLIRMDSSGKSTPMMDGVDSIVGGLKVSPNGRLLALVTLRERVELWVFDLERRTMSLVNAEGESWQPIWTPDSSALIFTRVIPGKRHEVVRKSITAGSAVRPEPLGIPLDAQYYPATMTPDGGTLMLTKEPSDTNLEERFVMYRLRGGSNTGAVASAELTYTSGPDESTPRLSSDGKLLAFVSKESGVWEAYVRLLDEPASRQQISAGGASEPCWSRDGKRLFFRDQKDVMFAVDVDASEGLKVSAAKRMFAISPMATSSLWGSYDTLPDGTFVMVEPAAWENEPAKIRVVLNWSQELKRLTAPAGNR